MTLPAFTEIAHKTLENLSDELDQQLSEYAQIDPAQDSLTIEFHDNRVILINLHHALQQIWVSSPISGGQHFLYDASQQRWLSTKDQHLDLRAFLEQDLMQLTANPSIKLRLTK